MAKHTEPILMKRCKFSGLAMKPTGDAGTDTVEFKIQVKDRSKWDELKNLIDDEEVEVSLLGRQGKLFEKGKGKKKGELGRGVKPGSEAASGASQAQD